MLFGSGGGFGITPLIAMSLGLLALGRDFEVLYSIPSRWVAGYLDDLSSFAWVDRVHLHVSDEKSLENLTDLLCGYQKGWHVYTCGPERSMDAVIAAAEAGGFPDKARHLEYFSVPEVPDYVNHDFILKLARSGRELHVPADKSATDVLSENGIHVDVKCSDGICGVCKCGLVDGDVEHRDFVLSKSQRKVAIILCQSRAQEKGGVITIDL